MIQITEKHYIGKGLVQNCYIHPENENLCIKVKFNNLDENNHFKDEIKYLQRIQKKNIEKKDPLFFAKYHGTIQTNLGIGYVYDLIRDEKTKTISLTMFDYLKMENSPFSDDLLEQKLIELKNLMIKYKVIIYDLTSKNICCKVLNNNTIELVVVDGLGHRDFIPSVDYISYFTKRKVEKIYQRQRLYNMVTLRKYLKKRKIW